MARERTRARAEDCTCRDVAALAAAERSAERGTGTGTDERARASGGFAGSQRENGREEEGREEDTFRIHHSDSLVSGPSPGWQVPKRPPGLTGRD